jgi:hypothetical protein
MTRKIISASVLLMVFGLLTAGPADAQQSINVQVGHLWVRGEAGRPAGDVLVANLSDTEPLAFAVSDFNGVTFGGEWLIGIGRYLEAGVGASYYSHTVPSLYRNLVNSDGGEIRQDLRLRIVPVTATFRVLPLGQHAVVQPYFGAGVAIHFWEYSEAGEFVDLNDYTIFRASYKANGTNVGPVVVGGLVVPIGSSFALGAEIRHQWHTEGKLSTSDFLGDRIDLGGTTVQAVFQIRFGRR